MTNDVRASFHVLVEVFGLSNQWMELSINARGRLVTEVAEAAEALSLSRQV